MKNKDWFHGFVCGVALALLLVVVIDRIQDTIVKIELVRAK